MEHQNVLRSLKETFGDIPSFIRENVKYLSYNDEHNDFTCVPCEKFIQKCLSKNATTNNFKQHLLSRTHVNNSFTSTDKLLYQLSTIFSGNVPPIISMNAEKLSIYGNHYKCDICEKIIHVNHNNISVTENNFSKHLLSVGHKKKSEGFYETLDQLYDIYGSISLTVLNHSSFLSKKGKHYLCTICDKQLMVHPTDVEETDKCFVQHLHSLKHIRNVKQTKAFSLVPELQTIFSNLPNYMLRNIEYISINGLNFFCSLCNENIKFNKHNTYETELNFKLHISSPCHEENLANRADPNNELFNRICSLYEEFPFFIEKNLKYLSVSEDDFYCEVCKETIKRYDEPELTRESLASHFEPLNHEAMVNLKCYTTSEVLKDLSDIFGAIPEIIQDNLQHIHFNGGDNFECVLCNKILKAKSNGDHDDNTSVTMNNFLQHLESNKHETALEEFEDINDHIVSSLKGIFNPVPQYVLNNVNFLSYKNDSNDFECLLCDKVFAVFPGSNEAELTEQNFLNHFLSRGHFANLKQEANSLMFATEALELIFGKIPNFILSNIQHIELQDNYYYCTLCEVKMLAREAESTEEQCRQHLFSSRHRDNFKDFEEDNDEAFQRLNQQFWRVPEVMLRNIDFLKICENDLFCSLCQELLFIDEEGLEYVKESLRDHIDSERHKFCLKSI